MNFFEEFQELDDLGVQFNTNKSSSWVNAKDERVKQGSLLRKYEYFLHKYKGIENYKMLELGAGPDINIGASCRVWKGYFPESAVIHVADIKPSANALTEEGFHVHIGDLGSTSFLRGLASEKWDFVIDDASHIWTHQILAFRNLFSSVRQGGVFIVEDLCTSFGNMRHDYGLGFDQKDAVSYFLALSRCVCGTDTDSNLRDSIYCMTDTDKLLATHIDMISWIGNSCIIVKK